MIQLTRRDLEAAYDQVANTHRSISGYRAKGESVARNAIATVETLAGAAASGVIAGRFGAPHVAVGGHTLPLDLLAGVALHGLAFFDMFGAYGDHVHNFSNGVMAQYIARWGVGYGTHLREKAGLPRIAGGAGSPHVAVGSPGDYNYRLRGNMPGTGADPKSKPPLSEAEIAALATSARY